MVSTFNGTEPWDLPWEDNERDPSTVSRVDVIDEGDDTLLTDNPNVTLVDLPNGVKRYSVFGVGQFDVAPPPEI